VRTIAIINQKGGCGKTTTAINLSALLARAGNRVLLVDMDPQSHCGIGLGVHENRMDMDISDALVNVGTRPLDPNRLFWNFGNNLNLAPSRMRLAGLESPRSRIVDAPDRDRRLLKVLGEFRNNFDIAVIDCSPAIGLLTFNALMAASVVMVPVETSFFSLQGATRQVNTVKSMSRKMSTSVSVWVLPTIHDDTNGVANDLHIELRSRFRDRLCPVTIRRDSRLKEAASDASTIHNYAPNRR
jgi:chromosome partitioning protein